MLVAATNPCACGHAPRAAVPLHRRATSPATHGGSAARSSTASTSCSTSSAPPREDLDRAGATTSAAERERVIGRPGAPGRAPARHGRGVQRADGLRAAARPHALATPEAETTLLDAYRRGSLSARGRDRALRVARTVADLAGSERVTREHVVTALGYRHEQDLGGEAVA